MAFHRLSNACSEPVRRRRYSRQYLAPDQILSLTTVGFGDLHPTTPWSKAFTVIYVLFGIGVLVAFVTKLVQYALRPQKTDETPEGGEKSASTGGDKQ